MTIEEKRGIIGGDEGPGEKFPTGMRVLAVDDDPICLKVLETLLIRCQYNVTTTNQAIKALNMLRENKANFDLVISDVHMPDMDGFKLLELVGLEMDLPVIMLSANGETKAVMKGIAHGACDYLLKPVRIEELKNIWQHVVRRKNFDQIEHCGLNIGKDYEKVQAANSEVTKAFDADRPMDSNTKFNKKRKDLNIEDEDDYEEGTHESEDPSCQKKPRVVWSVELHRKFVAAVNQLGVDRAVPKRILDIMNVDKLTRENVASHLQKYRLYLKRLSAVTTQQANMASSLGGRDTSFMHMGSFNNFGTSQALTTFQPIGVSDRTNPNLLGPPRATLGMVQLGRTQNNTNNPVNDISKFQNISVPVNQCENLFEGISTSLELDRLQQQPKRINESNNHLQGVFSDVSNSSFISSTNNSLLLQANQSPVSIPSSVANRHEMSPVISARFLDLGKRGESWQNAPTLNAYSGDSLLAGNPYSNGNLTSSNTRATLASTVLQIPRNPSNISSDYLEVPVQRSLVGQDVQCQTSSGITDPKFLSFESVEQKSNDSKQRCTVETNIAFSSSSNSTFTNQALLNNVAESQGLKNQFFNKKFDINVTSQPSFDTAFNTQYGKTDKSNFYNGLTFSEDNLFGVSKMQGGFGSNGCNFDDLMNEMIKSERDDIGFIVDGEISSDLFYLSTVL